MNLSTVFIFNQQCTLAIHEGIAFLCDELMMNTTSLNSMDEQILLTIRDEEDMELVQDYLDNGFISIWETTSSKMSYQLQGVRLTKDEWVFVVFCLLENQATECYTSEAVTPEYVQHLKEVFSELRPTLIHDNINHAFECILEFGSDYQMYLSYLSQFRVTTKGEQVRLVPVSYKVYNKLYDEKLTLDLEAWDHLNDMQAEQAQDLFELNTELPF